MFTGSLTKEQVTDLYNLAIETTKDNPSFMRHENLLSSINLMWFQCMCIEHALISKGTLCSLGTGLGKTASSAGYMLRELERNDKDKCGLFFCLPESIEQVKNDFRDYLDIDVPTFTGERDSLYCLDYMSSKDVDILIFSYQALYTKEFANWFVRNTEGIACTVSDEVHKLSQESIINSICRQIYNNVDSNLFLSATPITVSPVQVITLLNMLDKNFIPTGKKFLKPYEIRDPETFEVVDYKKLDDISTLIYPRYVSWTRKELGLQGEYIPHVLLVKPTEEQMNCGYRDIEDIIKGQRDSRQVETLIAICKDMRFANKKGLIYCNTRKNCQMLFEVLKENGFRVAVANGEQENKKFRQEVLKLYKDKNLDIIITNLTTSLNLDSDYLIFWENTNQAVQMIGRCERGFAVKVLDIFFILTEDTVELEQFNRNVYRRCKWLYEALEKDTEVFLRVGEAIENYMKDHKEHVYE